MPAQREGKRIRLHVSGVEGAATRPPDTVTGSSVGVSLPAKTVEFTARDPDIAQRPLV